MRSSLIFALLVALLRASIASGVAPPPSASVRPIHPGVEAFSFRSPDGTLAIFGVIWDLSRDDVRLRAVAAGDRARGREPISRQVERLRDEDCQPLAAFNGDFSMVVGPYAGSTNGTFVRRGELLRFVDGRPAVVVRDDGTLAVALLRHRAAWTPPGGLARLLPALNRPLENGGLALYTPAWGEFADTPTNAIYVPLRGPGRPVRPSDRFDATVLAPAETGRGPIPRDGLLLAADPDHAEALRGLRPGDVVSFSFETEGPPAPREVVGGWPILLKDGQVQYTRKDEEPRHPRTAFGHDGRQAVLLVVDGRAPGHSDGVTLPELAELMRSMGCTEALNLDGGGSSTCWVRGQVLNRPSDGHERAVPNGLALVSTRPVGPAHAVRFEHDGLLRLAPGARAPVVVRVEDERLNPVANDRAIELQCRGAGELRGGELLAGAAPGEGEVTARLAELPPARLPFVVSDAIAALRVRPTLLELLPGGVARIEVRGVDDAGAEVLLAPDAVRFDAPPGLVEVMDDAVRGGAAGTRGVLQVRGYGRTAEIGVAVAAPEPFESFDAPAGQFRAFPEFVGGELRFEKGTARLTWRFAERDATQAAYLWIDRPLGRALALQARVRVVGGEPRRVQVKAATVDGNGQRLLHTLFEGELDGQWRDIRCEIPPGLPQPVTWQSVYVVSTTREHARAGTLEVDALHVWRVPTPQR